MSQRSRKAPACSVDCLVGEAVEQLREVAALRALVDCCVSVAWRARTGRLWVHQAISDMEQTLRVVGNALGRGGLMPATRFQEPFGELDL